MTADDHSTDSGLSAPGAVGVLSEILGDLRVSNAGEERASDRDAGDAKAKLGDVIDRP